MTPPTSAMGRTTPSSPSHKPDIRGVQPAPLEPFADTVEHDGVGAPNRSLPRTMPTPRRSKSRQLVSEGGCSGRCRTPTFQAWRRAAWSHDRQRSNRAFGAVTPFLRNFNRDFEDIDVWRAHRPATEPAAT